MVETFCHWRKSGNKACYKTRIDFGGNWYVFAYKNHTYVGKYGGKAQVWGYFMENEHLGMWFKTETLCLENIGYDSTKLRILAPNLLMLLGYRLPALPCPVLPCAALPRLVLPHLACPTLPWSPWSHLLCFWLQVQPWASCLLLSGFDNMSVVYSCLIYFAPQSVEFLLVNKVPLVNKHSSKDLEVVSSFKVPLMKKADERPAVSCHFNCCDKKYNLRKKE